MSNASNLTIGEAIQLARTMIEREEQICYSHSEALSDEFMEFAKAKGLPLPETKRKGLARLKDTVAHFAALKIDGER